MEQIDPKQVMQGDITTDGGTTTSTGAKYDEWLAKQKDKPKPAPTTDASREDFFAKAKREREERLKGSVKPLTPKPPALRPSGDNYRVKAMTDKLTNHIEYLEIARQELIDKYGSEKHYTEQIDVRLNNAKDKLKNIAKNEKNNGLPHIPMGKNTHTKSTQGFVHGSKSRIKIDPKLSNDPNTVVHMDLIQSAWNNLPDDVRDNIKTLNLKMSRTSGRGSIQGGKWITDKGELIMNIHPRTREGVIEHNFYHEVGHSKWHKLQSEDPAKVEKFIQAQQKIGTSPTRYSQSYVLAHRKMQAKVDAYKRKYEKMGVPISARNAKVIEHNLKVTKDIYQNETHSELNAYAMGELPERLITANKKNMTALVNAYKELWDLE